MANRIPLAVEEWYHCYNRGVDKREIFVDRYDYERFVLLLYVCNGSYPVHLSDIREKDFDRVIENTSAKRGEPLVEIGSYCLMPNHVHFALKEIREGGLSLFMQKVFTSYTMYFNEKYNRSGALLAGTFKSKHLYNDRYLKHAISYIHLNPVELFEPGWKKGKGNLIKIRKFLNTYNYSSLPDFYPNKRTQNNILGPSIFKLFDRLPSLSETLENARAYYEDMGRVKFD